MKRNKSILLLLMLAFPVLVYLFLQGFGSNHFDIPVFFENGISDELVGCEMPVSSPYRTIAFSQFGATAPFDETGIVVYDVSAFFTSSVPLIYNNLNSLLSRYESDQRIKFISLCAFDSLGKSRNRVIVMQKLDVENIMQYGRCILRQDLTYDTLSQQILGGKLVLVDKNRLIRGYYDPSDMEEVDRLKVELHILISDVNEN